MAAVTMPFVPPVKKKAVLESTPQAAAIPALNDSAEAKAQAAELTKVHTAFATKLAADQAAATEAALASKATYAGFGVSDISQFFGKLAPTVALDIINQANAGMAGKTYQAGLQHLAEHPKGSHYSGDFNPTRGGDLTRLLLGVQSLGGSELLREKPFQPGGENLGGVKSLLASPAPPTPAAPKPAPDQAAARAALDKADLERRRQIGAGAGTTSALGLPGDATVKRSVLG